MTVEELRLLSDDELKELSLQKYKTGKRKGCYTALANRAQKVRNERSDYVIQRIHNGKVPRKHNTSDRQSMTIRKIGVKKNDKRRD